MKYKACPRCNGRDMNVERIFISVSTYLDGKLTSGPVTKGRLSQRTIVCEHCGYSEDTTGPIDGEKSLSLEEYRELFKGIPKQLKGRSDKKTSRG